MIRCRKSLPTTVVIYYIQNGRASNKFQIVIITLFVVLNILFICLIFKVYICTRIRRSTIHLLGIEPTNPMIFGLLKDNIKLLPSLIFSLLNFC